MAAPIPFRVHFDPVAGETPAPVVITTATPKQAGDEARARFPGRAIRKIKRDKSGARS